MLTFFNGSRNTLKINREFVDGSVQVKQSGHEKSGG